MPGLRLFRRPVLTAPGIGYFKKSHLACSSYCRHACQPAYGGELLAHSGDPESRHNKQEGKREELGHPAGVTQNSGILFSVFCSSVLSSVKWGCYEDSIRSCSWKCLTQMCVQPHTLLLDAGEPSPGPSDFLRLWSGTGTSLAAANRL